MGLSITFFFCKLTAALHLTSPAAKAFILFLAFMVIAPLLKNSIERQGSHLSVRALAFVSYGWMGPIYLAFVVS